jgi:hypothetical protein
MTNESQDTGTVEVWIETVRVRVLSEADLQERASSEAPDEAPIPSFDPYNTDINALQVGPRPRRNLDDMRRLSEAIVRNRINPKGNA